MKNKSKGKTKKRIIISEEKKMRDIRKRIISFITALTLFFLIITVIPVRKAEAATVDYITVEAFAKYLAMEVGIAAVDGSCVTALKAKGLIKDGDFTSYKINLTRGDCMVLLNRADE